MKPAALEKRMAEQSEILNAAVDFVKPGGRMVYVTCSFLMEEDEDRVAAFLEAHPDFTAESAADAATASGQLTERADTILRANSGAHGSVRLTPRRAGTDGFFFAVLRRRVANASA